MAVQKSKKSRSKRDMRRAHDALSETTLSIDQRGNLHRRHHIAEDGTYRGRQIIIPKDKRAKKEQEEASEE